MYFVWWTEYEHLLVFSHSFTAQILDELCFTVSIYLEPQLDIFSELIFKNPPSGKGTVDPKLSDHIGCGYSRIPGMCHSSSFYSSWLKAAGKEDRPLWGWSHSKAQNWPWDRKLRMLTDPIDNPSFSWKLQWDFLKPNCRLYARWIAGTCCRVENVLYTHSQHIICVFLFFKDPESCLSVF